MDQNKELMSLIDKMKNQLKIETDGYMKEIKLTK